MKKLKKLYKPSYKTKEDIPKRYFKNLTTSEKKKMISEVLERPRIYALKDQISFKQYRISDHKSARNKYGKWEKFEEQLSTMENELSILENQLKEKLNETLFI